MHNFQESLKAGQKYENQFLKYHKDLLIPNHGRNGDFFTLYDNSKVELKSDRYNMNNTPYFFFEHYSVLEKEKLGGVWQSLDHGVKFFVYFFPENEKYFVFYLPNLVCVLNALKNKFKEIRVRNINYTTTGFKVLRDDLKPIMTEHKLKEGNKLWTFRK